MPSARNGFPRLAGLVRRSFILAYKEDTARLEKTLREEGLVAEVLRPAYTEEQLLHSRTIRCLLNHAGAWEKASQTEGYSMIVEADFVPCRGMGAEPIPFDPVAVGPNGWAFLYAGGPRLFRVHADGSLEGHAACPVAYLVSQDVAAKLVEYCREELERHGDPTQYSLWDTQFQWHLMGKGARCFMPWRQYGEHGGLSNPEHRKAGTGVASRSRLLQWLQLGKNHHAEVLRGPLSFLPDYALGSRARLFRVRLEAKIVGFLRLLCGKVSVGLGELTAAERLRLRWAALRRLLAWY